MFTGALLAGIRTGAADSDHDGLICVDDADAYAYAYAYAYEHVREAGAPADPAALAVRR